MTKRALIIGLSLTPIVGLMALFAWGLVQSGGRPGGLLVNTRFGEVAVRPGPARDFTLQGLDGQTIALADFSGKVVMVDFWASWCPPCRQEAPTLAQVYQEYQGEAIEFVGVAIWDTPEGARKLLARSGSGYPAGLDEKGAIAIDYGVRGIPEKHFLTPDGQVVRKFIGPVDEGVLRQVLDELLESANPS